MDTTERNQLLEGLKLLHPDLTVTPDAYGGLVMPQALAGAPRGDVAFAARMMGEWVTYYNVSADKVMRFESLANFQAYARRKAEGQEDPRDPEWRPAFSWDRDALAETL